MKAQGVVFLGVRTTETDVMAAFFTDVMGLPLAQNAHDFVRFQLPNRDQIELWGPSLETQAHVTTGPMPEFLVHDVEHAQAELEALAAFHQPIRNGPSSGRNGIKEARPSGIRSKRRHRHRQPGYRGLVQRPVLLASFL